MKAKHTPGPWMYTKCRCGDPVCRAYHISHSRSNGGFDEADARLIAAAPNLLSALEAMVKTFGNSTVLSDYGRGVVAQANAAIAKAEGRS